MNNWIFTFLLLGVTTFSFGQKNKISVFDLDQIRGIFIQRNTVGPFTGTAVEKHPNGKKKMHVSIKDGKFQGKVREWTMDGVKVYEADYVDGKKHGMELQWYATKKKKVEVPYSEGLPNGMAYEWHKNGEKKSEGLFKNGKEEGKHYWWYANKQLDQEAFYIDGKEDGIVKNWFQNGKPQLESNYKMGIKEGNTTKWFENGQIKSIEPFKNDQADGESKFWNDKGIVHTIKIHDAGKLIQEKIFRSASINVGNGYVQVYNEPGAYFKVPVLGDGVRSVDLKNITYIVDGQLIQLYNIHHERFVDTINESEKHKPVMEMYLNYESRNLKEREQNFTFDIQKENFVTKNDIEAMHWHFESPSKYADEQTSRTVQEEHYISLICGNQILSIYSAVTKSDDRNAVIALLKNIAEEVWVSDEPIDLNEIISDLRK